MLKRARSKLGEKISSTGAAQTFYQSDEYQQLKTLRNEAKEFRSEVREQIDNSPNPVVYGASMQIDKIKKGTPCALAVEKMQKYDPDFDLEDLTDEAEEIFKEFYCNYLTGNTEYIKMVCGGSAGALL